jgi:hypothetical protein
MNTTYIVNCIKDNVPVIFLKYGDGEYLCSSKNFNDKNNNNKANCDNDNYTIKLSKSITESFKYIAENCKNYYFGRWHDKFVVDYWNSLVNNEVNWVDYHTLLIYNNDLSKLEIYKAIKNSKQKKIYICNELLVKAEILLNIDYMIYVPKNNWFDTNFESILEKIKEIMKLYEDDYIVLTSCGMSAKVLISELYKIYPNEIYLDIGSGLDTICTKRSTRGLLVNYEFCYNYFKSILPENWDDSKYDYIYKRAQIELGLHLPKN